MRVCCHSQLKIHLIYQLFDICVIFFSAFFDNLYCTLCDLVLSEAEDSSSFDQLLLEIKERDLVSKVYVYLKQDQP